MPHYRLMYPSEYLNAADLNEKDAVVEIASVTIEDVPGVDGKKSPKPVLTFKGAKKRWPLPKTCARKIAERFGNKTEEWIGEKVTLYPTTCQAFGQTVECVRVR